MFQTFSGKSKKILKPGDIFLLHQGKSQAESEIGVRSRESICYKRIVHHVVSKDLKIESVAQNIIGGQTTFEHLYPGYGLIDILNKLPGKSLVITDGEIKPQVKITIQYLLSSPGPEHEPNLIKSVTGSDSQLIVSRVRNLVTCKIK